MLKRYIKKRLIVRGIPIRTLAIEKNDDDRETTVHKVAWSAVKNSYSKNDNGNWVKSSN